MFIMQMHILTVISVIPPHQNSAITQLLAQGTEIENLYKQVLKRRGHLHTNIKDMSSW